MAIQETPLLRIESMQIVSIDSETVQILTCHEIQAPERVWTVTKNALGQVIDVVKEAQEREKPAPPPEAPTPKIPKNNFAEAIVATRNKQYIGRGAEEK